VISIFIGLWKIEIEMEAISMISSYLMK